MISSLQPQILSGVVQRIGRVWQCDQRTHEESKNSSIDKLKYALARAPSHGHVTYLNLMPVSISWPCYPMFAYV
jgi:hypothetical protein